VTREVPITETARVGVVAGHVGELPSEFAQIIVDADISGLTATGSE
jgi:hypothetical protein